jgi:type VI secretion system Hcp family effector
MGFAVLALLLCAWHDAAAQTETFMQVPNIPGESSVHGYEGWIEVASLTQSFENTGRGRNLCTAVVVKRVDKAGPLLWAAAVTGQVFNEVRVDILRAAEKPLKFYELILYQASIANIASVPSDLAENLTIVGRSAKLSYFPQRPDGTLEAPIVATASCR